MYLEMCAMLYCNERATITKHFAVGLLKNGNAPSDNTVYISGQNIRRFLFGFVFSLIDCKCLSKINVRFDA